MEVYTYGKSLWTLNCYGYTFSYVLLYSDFLIFL